MIYIDGIVERLQGFGGITVYFREILQRLARDEVPFGIGSYHAQGSLLEGVDKQDRQKFRIPMAMRLLERYRRAEVPSDTKVFHSTYYRAPATRSVPSVLTVHDFTYERVVGGLRSAVHSNQKMRAIRAADTIICVSHSTKRDLLDLVSDCDADRIQVVHNGVGDAFKVLPRDTISNFFEGAPYVLFVGSRGGYKNFDLAVKVVSRLTDHHLVAVGGGKISSAEGRLVAAQLPERFHHLGYVCDDELNMLYNSADFLVYPSSYEGFGIPLVESMKAGCPVLAVNTSSIPEVAGPAGYLAEEPDEEALWCAALKLLNNGKERSNRIKLGLERSGGFSWDKCYQETAAILQTYL